MRRGIHFAWNAGCGECAWEAQSHRYQPPATIIASSAFTTHARNGQSICVCVCTEFRQLNATEPKATSQIKLNNSNNKHTTKLLEKCLTHAISRAQLHSLHITHMYYRPAQNSLYLLSLSLSHPALARLSSCDRDVYLAGWPAPFQAGKYSPKSNIYGDRPLDAFLFILHTWN